jgi:hypothetical protein
MGPTGQNRNELGNNFEEIIEEVTQEMDNSLENENKDDVHEMENHGVKVQQQ